MPSPDERKLTLYPMVRRDAPDPTDPAVVARILGTVTATIAPATTSTVTSVAVTTVSTTLLAANASRIMATFYNLSVNRFLFLKLGAGATTLDFTVRIGPQGFFELPFPGFTGIITGIWNAAGTTACLVTELT